jgi:hypothetical protein
MYERDLDEFLESDYEDRYTIQADYDTEDDLHMYDEMDEDDEDPELDMYDDEMHYPEWMEQSYAE